MTVCKTNDPEYFDLSVLGRLEATFGRPALRPMLDGLKSQLIQALGTPDRATAHRIAGLAGTLGFADVSALWLAWSEGDESKLAAALDAARRAIVAIDRHKEKASGH